MPKSAADAPGAWPPFVARERVLHDLEAAIAATPDALDARYYHAAFLRDHGDLAGAIAEFETVLAAAPDHVATLLALGAALHRCGRRLDARARFERAVALAPRHAGALTNLANVLAADDPERAQALYAAALAADADCVPAHRGLCSLAAARGDAAAAARHRAAGYAVPFGLRPYTGAAAPIAALALVATDGGNIPREALLDERTFLVHELFVEAYRGEALPPHRLIVNAIADADRAAFALERAAEIAGDAPVVNPPLRVAQTGRAANARRLAAIGEAIVPPVRRVARAEVAALDLPAIVRVPGLHMGRGMMRIETPDDAARAARTLPDRDDLLAIGFVDTRSADGAWRKYRVMTIGGRLYPLHLAIAHRWDVHYFSAEMSANAGYRDEEARFLADPQGVLGARAWRTLEAVGAALGLDYAGIDFALDAAGRAVIFEANAAMTVLAPPPGDERFAYRRPATDAIARALVALVRSRAA